MQAEHRLPDDGMPHQADEQCPCKPLGDTLRVGNHVISVVWHHRKWKVGGDA